MFLQVLTIGKNERSTKIGIHRLWLSKLLLAYMSALCATVYQWWMRSTNFYDCTRKCFQSCV